MEQGRDHFDPRGVYPAGVHRVQPTAAGAHPAELVQPGPKQPDRALSIQRDGAGAGAGAAGLPPAGMLDLSPIVVLIAAMVLQELLIRLVVSVF